MDKPLSTLRCTEATADFIRRHCNDDVTALALKASARTDIDVAYALDQIAGRQAARRKLPSWAAADDMVFPPHISMEQCSSEPAALYKAAVAARLTAAGGFIDMTGGFGVDFSFIARHFPWAVYVERQQNLCDIAANNFRVLGLQNVEIVCGDGTEYVSSVERRTALIYADPARRDTAGARTFAIADCTPDVTRHIDTLLRKSERLMIKLSPMLDWRKAAADIGPSVREIHIVSVDNECKELLLVASSHADDDRVMLHCVNLGGREWHTVIALDGSTLRIADEEGCAVSRSDGRALQLLAEGFCDDASGGFCHGASDASGAGVSKDDAAIYLYEPNASLMKGGCFDVIAGRYGLTEISANSHLFVRSGVPCGDFPGRTFLVRSVTSMNKKELRRTLASTDRANIAVRNFPISADSLRRRLKLKDGGDVYLFATTLGDGSHRLLLTTALRHSAD
ncbi:MAG: SAM-dependent methyltransferase [Prevotella sp.]